MEFKNPSKKLKLDLPNNRDGNDDLWGEDITAEEFDMLEVQATQKVAASSSNIYCQPISISNGTKQATLLKEEDMKQQQYELEGKVKILSDSVEKVKTELKEEKLNRDKIIAQKVNEFQEKENIFRKEIQKLESMLQFKNQEMKTVYDKDPTIKEKKRSPQSSKASDEFLKNFQFEAKSLNASDAQDKTKSSFRRYKLQVDTPQGKTQGSDIVSSFLCNRLVVPPASNFFFSPLTQNPDVLGRTPLQISAVSIARLNFGRQTEELLDYFDCLLKNYLTHLKSVSNRNAVAGPSSTSPLSLRKKESRQDRALVVASLKDLAFFLSCHPFSSLIQKLEAANADLGKDKKFIGQNKRFQPLNCESTIDGTITKLREKMHSLIQSLVCLSNPNTYPNGYGKGEEIEGSLACLVSLSSIAPHNLIQFIGEIPFAVLVNRYSVASLQMVLKLLINLVACKEIIPIIIHQKDLCILCSIASLTLQKISTSPMKFLNVMLTIEDFFAVFFTAYSFSELKLEKFPCSSLILQGIVTSLWKLYTNYKPDNSELILVLKKGFTLLHFLARYVLNFKGRRAVFENHYISLVCGMLTLSKENPAFKEFRDVIHDLWDFQDDTSELDWDEPLEDSSQTMDISSPNIS
ncbi:uncharacterized protein CDAR_464161 [Caerostris darwini]|uniref:ATR-interacting protein mus304 n=1 Tax=Caerostris darwini TaxID=1538125 RepID=A0AAV4VTY0_9ARAC|nr:uncharacterized protein CDAR_464161 [Caerostris darwini]